MHKTGKQAARYRNNMKATTKIQKLQRSQPPVPALTIRNVGKKQNGTTVVDGLSFEVEKSGTTVLMGPSGCGKTTTLRLIAGLEAVDWGEISIDGKPVSSPELLVPACDRSLSMIFQDLALWPHMTASQHIDFVLDRKRYNKKERTARCAELLDLVRLSNMHAYPNQLSGGEQQRLAIARGMASEPETLLMDEPFSHLDGVLKKTLLTQVRRLLQERQITTIYVTHQWQEAVFIGDTILTMGNGKINGRYDPGEFGDLMQENESRLWFGGDKVRKFEAKKTKDVSYE